MAENIDDLTVDYEDNGVLTTKQLDKVVLTRGAWSTILYKFHNWDFKKEAYGPTQFTIRRYQKREGEFRQKSKFNISSVGQAQKIIAALNEWIETEDTEAK